jgi:hypothetical protein
VLETPQRIIWKLCKHAHATRSYWIRSDWSGYYSVGLGVGIIPRDIRDVGEEESERRGSFKADEFQDALSAATIILISRTEEQVSLV